MWVRRIVLIAAAILAGPALPAAGALLCETSVPATLSVIADREGLTAEIQMGSDGNVRLRAARRPAQVLLNGKELAPQAWRWQDGMVSLQLSAGQHTLQMNTRRQRAAAAPLRVVLEAAGRRAPLDTASRSNRVYAWGAFPGPTGLYRFSARGAGMPVRLAAGAAGVQWHPGRPAPEALLAAGTPITVSLEGRQRGGDLSVRLDLVAPAVALKPEATPAQQLLPGILVEAEAFVRQGGGEVSISRGEHAGTRGNASIYNWGAAGQWLEWQVDVPDPGLYRIYAAAAAEPAEALRALTINGREPFAGAGLLRFPGTGGWGRVDPGQWRLFALRNASGNPAVARLSAGKHILRLESPLAHSLNLDYLVLSPERVRPRGENAQR